MAGAARGDEEPPAPAPADTPSWHDELEALTAIGTALERLDPPARERALAWAVARYGMRGG